MVEKSPDLAESWVTKKMPGSIRDARFAYGGAYVALAPKDMKKIIVFNTISGGGFKYITVASSDYMMTAAEQNLLVYHPATGILETFDLGTLKRVKAKRVKCDGKLAFLETGLRNPSQAFVAYDSSHNRKHGILDLTTMKIDVLTSTRKSYSHNRPNRFRCGSSSYRMLMTCSDDLTGVAMWATSVSPTGYEYVRMDLEKKTFENFCDHSSYGSLTVSSDGGFVYTGNGWIFKNGESKMKQLKNTYLLGVGGGNFFLGVDKEGVKVYESFSATALTSHPLPFKAPRHYYHERNRLPRHKRYFASALTNRLTVIDDKSGNIHLRPLLPKDLAPKKGSACGNSLRTKRGQAWAFKLFVPKGMSCSIEFGPKGLSVKDDVLYWKVPSTAPLGIVEILVKVTATSGDEDYRILKLKVL
jgi:hypothetical protein